MKANNRNTVQFIIDVNREEDCTQNSEVNLFAFVYRYLSYGFFLTRQNKLEEDCIKMFTGVTKNECQLYV